MLTCNHCNQEFDDSHDCEVAGKTITSEDDGDFVASALISYETHDPLLGAVVGGDIFGALLGDLL